MNRYKVRELIPKTQDEIRRITRGLKNGKLYHGNELICEDKDISKFYVAVLSHLAVEKHVDIKQGLDKTCNDTGEKINDGSAMRKIDGTNLWVDTKSNNDTKYKKMLKCFDVLSKKENIDLYEFEIQAEVNEDVEKMSNSEGRNVNVNRMVGDGIKLNKQIIFTGAPGTGKTYSVRKFVEEHTKEVGTKYKFVQFHSSYDYTDFVEGLRPVPDGNNGNMFVRMDGTFKAFCRDIVKANLERLKNYDSSITTIDTYYQYMKDANVETREKVYNLLDETPYYFIIDEINRADLSRVFGELMFGLEESYREVNNRFDTQYKNLVTYHMNEKAEAEVIADDCFKNGFFVPYNLHIIGTMNDIDRSVESFDFALRRRFVWEDVKANDVMYESLKSMRDDKNGQLSDTELESIVENIKKMNEIISRKDGGVGLTEAYHIGPAYFKELVKASDDEAKKELEVIFKNRIEPILIEYTRGRRIDIDTLLINPCKEALGI